MIQDIAPHIYHNEMSWQSPRGDDLVLLFSENGEVCAQSREGRLHLPTVLETALAPEALQYLFSIDRQAFYLADAPDTLPDGWEFFSTGALRRCVADEAMFACAAAGSLWRWYRGTRFCGRCGGTLEKSRTERAMVCPACGNVIYPKICPAIIAAVHDGERLVLTRYRDRPFKNLALIAGFNEIGESIEQTVRREVLEETGLHVKNLRFYKSQPWVFTDSLLFGFFAELDGSDKITVQEDELAEAGWYLREELPEDTTHISLTAEMIEAGVDMDNPIAARAVHDQAFFKPAFEAYRDNFKKLYDTGVTVLAGSDMVLYKAPPLPIHQELGYMVDYGITPMEAIRTATYNAASVLGIENETGSLKEGLAGDLLIVKGDVSKNIRALDDVQEVYLAGEIVYTV